MNPLNRSAALRAFVAFIAGVAVASCSKTPDEGPVDSSFSVASRVINADVDGGDFHVVYSISGPMEGGVAEVVADKDWIHVGTVYNTEFSCTVDANDTGKDRIGKITLKCRRTVPLSINVIQSAVKSDKPIYSNYEITVSDVTTSTCRLRIRPVDAGKTYVWGFVRKSDYDRRYTAESYIDARIGQIESWCAETGYTPDMFLQSGALDTDDLLESQRPSLFDRTDYYATAFELRYDSAGRKLVAGDKIDILEFRTASAPASDMDFELRYSDGTITVSPTRDEPYVFNYASKESWDDIDPDYAVQYYISTYLSQQGSFETHTGFWRKSLASEGLVRGKVYVAFVAGYRDSKIDGGLTTEVKYIEFKY